MNNKERLTQYAKRHGIADSEEILDRRLAIIPEQSRKIIKTRWGFNGRKHYMNFKNLGKKLSLQNPRALYFQSMSRLENAAYAEIIADRNKIGNWEISVGLGRLACSVLSTSNITFGVDTVYGEKLIQLLEQCSQRDKEIIYLRFGLDGNGARTLEKVSKCFNISVERVRKIVKEVVTELGKKVYVEQFYIPYIFKLN